MNYLEEATKKIHELCPETMEKSFGCHIEYEGKHGIYIEYITGFADTFKLDDQFKTTGMSIITNPKLKILGHDITLEHVLKAISKGKSMKEHYAVSTHGLFLEREVQEITSTPYSKRLLSTGVGWELGKPFHLQKPEVHEFVCQVLNINNEEKVKLEV